VLNVTVKPPTCGDGIVELATGEECDDGPSNGMMGDGCSASCQFVQKFTKEVEPNSLGAPDMIDGFPGVIGAINPASEKDFYGITVTVPNSSIQLRVTNGVGGCPPGFSSVLTLFSPGLAQLATDQNGGVGTCSAILPTVYPAAANLAPGVYVAEVREMGNNVIPEYVLEYKVSPPGCGDGIIEPGEQCDDGPLNGTPGDGCDANCHSLPPWEIDPNNSLMTATPQWPGVNQWNGSIRFLGDHDYYKFVVPAGMHSVALATHDIGKPASCSFDSVIYLYDGNGNQIAKNDDGALPPCSQIPFPAAVPLMLSAGTYYCMVQKYNDDKTIPAYELDLTVQ
jgi:cysteine-rich repeat protein